ncbi:MAG: disulfide bond formation protein B [Hyphomicrobium sp.]|jgi:disulfide bond formation protein DsbB
MSAKLAVTLNALALYAISGVLAFAFYWQFAYSELPCPLCLLQRVAFCALAVGPILAIRHGPKPQYYGLVILAALLGAIISSRQMLLHILPGDAGFGSPFLGAHFYTWAFVAFVVAILAAAVMLAIGQRQFEVVRPPATTAFERSAIWVVLGLTMLNALSVFLECGLSACPSNPVHYQLLG